MINIHAIIKTIKNSMKTTNSLNHNKYYYRDGTTSTTLDETLILHREGDLPAIEFTDGTKQWYINDNCFD